MGGSLMECGKVREHYEIPNFDPRPALLKWPCQEQHVFGSTASAPASDISVPVCTDGYGRFCSLWVRRRRPNHWPRCLPMSNPLTSPWIARQDGSGWWDNRLAAEHLPRDLVRPSSGLKELAQTMMMKQLLLVCYRLSHRNQPCCAVFLCGESTNNKSLRFFHPQLFLPNSFLEQISYQRLKIPPSVSQAAHVWEPLGQWFSTRGAVAP